MSSGSDSDFHNDELLSDADDYESEPEEQEKEKARKKMKVEKESESSSSSPSSPKSKSKGKSKTTTNNTKKQDKKEKNNNNKKDNKKDNKEKKEKPEDTRVYVMDTGASKGDLLVGCSAANKGLVIKIICRECVQSDGSIKEEDDILPLPNSKNLLELVSEEGTWEDDDTWDGKTVIETSSDFSDANPYKIANGKHYISHFQRAICVSREDLKELAAEEITPTGLALSFLSHTSYNKTEEFKSVSKQAVYKKQMKKVDEKMWLRAWLTKDSLFDNIRFEVMNSGAGNRNWAFETSWANCKDQSRGITFDDVRNEILTQQNRTKSSAPPTYFLNYHNLEKMNNSSTDITKYYTLNYAVLEGVAPHPEHGEVTQKAPEAAFQLLYEKGVFVPNWISKKSHQGAWPPTLAWNVVLDVSGKKVLFSTNLVPDKKLQWHPASYDGPSYEELKSLLQKLTRLRYGEEAVRVANQLMNLRRDYSFTKKCYRFGIREFLHRIMVINLEDGFVHPNYPILGWLLMVEYCCAPYWFPHKEHIALCLKTVYDIAHSEFRERIPPATYNSSLLDLKDLEDLSSWEACFVASVQMRVSQKGTQGDKLFMLREMNMWMKRFKNRTKSDFGSHQKILEKWKDYAELPPIFKKDILSQIMLATDWCVNAIDFHIYGQILDRLIEESPDIYHKLQEYAKKQSVQVPDLLQTMVWENRSAVYRKVPIETGIWPNTANADPIDVNLRKLFLTFGKEILDLIAAEYIFISNAKNFSKKVLPQPVTNNNNNDTNNNNNINNNNNNQNSNGKQSNGKASAKSGTEVAPAPIKGGKKITNWCDANIDWHFHLRKICEEFEFRTEVIKVPKKETGIELDVKFYIYKTKTSKFMITRVNTKGTSTPHSLFSMEDVNTEDESDEVHAAAERVFAGYTSDTDKHAWKKVLQYLIGTFEANKKKEKQDSIYYRPSWFDADLFLPLFEFKVEKKDAGWELQVAKTTKMIKFKQVTDVPVEDIKNLFGFKDKVPVMTMPPTPAVKEEEPADKKGKGKRTHDDVAPAEILPPKIAVLDYEGENTSVQITPVFSAQELKHIAEVLHEAEPSAKPLFEVAKHLMLAVCYKMVLREGKKHIIIPPSPESKKLFVRLAAARIVMEEEAGYVLAAGILTSTVAIFVFHLVWDIPVSYIVYPREEIRQVFVKICKSVPNPVSLLPALYKVMRLLRDSIDNHQLTIGFAKRLRGNTTEGPEACDRDAKLILLVLFHGSDICCTKKLGLDVFEIRNCVPKKCLEQIYALAVELSAALAKAPAVERRVIGNDKPLIITGQKFDVPEADEWSAEKCISVQKELEAQGKCGTAAYLAACERLAYHRFSKSQSRTVLGWQQEGVRWLLKAEAVLGGGLLADDMGLGKTLQSLLLYKSYHKPVGPTLILCKPVNIHRPWAQELLLQDNFERSISFYIHHTDLAAEFTPAKKSVVTLKKRKTDAEEIRKFNLVITSYTTFMTEWRSGTSPLQGIWWERIILDEATVIKNATTLTAKAVRSLNAQYRWALTGTPVENNVSDLGGLLHFLQVKPFCYDDWFTRYQDKRRFEMLHTIMLRRHKEGIIKQRKQVVLLPVIMSPAERAISTYIESVYNQVVQDNKIDTSNTKGKDKNMLNNWLAKRIATTTNPAVWLFWNEEKTDVNGPVRRVAQGWVKDDVHLKDLPKEVFAFMKDNFGDNKGVADVEIPQALLESGKFMQVCKLVEQLVGSKPPSARQSMEPKIKNMQKELNIDTKEINALLDSMFNGKQDEHMKSVAPESIAKLVKAGWAVAESASLRAWLDGLKDEEVTSLANSGEADSNFLENDQLLSERLISKAKVAAPIAKILKKWKPAWSVTAKAWTQFNTLCGESFGTEGKMRPIQKDEKIVVWVNNQKIARMLERLLAPTLLKFKLGYTVSDASGGRGWVSETMKDTLEGTADSIWKKGCEYDSDTKIWKRKDKNGNTMAQEVFAQDPQCRVFLTTYGSSSHGIGLTAARNVILAESHYNPAQILQSEDRCYRIGQKRDVFVYHLQSYFDADTPTVEEVVFKVLERKRKLIQETVEGGASEIDATKEEGLVDAGYYVPRVN